MLAPAARLLQPLAHHLLQPLLRLLQHLPTPEPGKCQPPTPALLPQALLHSCRAFCMRRDEVSATWPLLRDFSTTFCQQVLGYSTQ